MVKSKEETEEIKEKVGRYGIKPVLTLLLFLNLAFLVFSVSRIMGNISGLKPLIWLLLILSIIAIPVIPYGFLKRKKWSLGYALLISIIYTTASIIFLVSTGSIIIWYLLFILTFISVVSLVLSSTRQHFRYIEDTEETSEEERVKIGEKRFEESETEEEPYKHGEFTLYKKLVPMKSGSSRVFYFFSRERSDKGIPSPLPDGYEVHINKKSGVPYLKKKGR